MTLPKWVEECGDGENWDAEKLKQALAVAVETLESAIKLDRSVEYKYGEHDRQGYKPGIGQRWKTPKELAKDALAKIEGMGDWK